MAWAVRTVDNQLEFGRQFDRQIRHCGTLYPSRSLRAADIGVGAMGPRFRRDLEDCLLLGREAHAARTDQAGVRRLEFPERAADRPLEVNVLVVGPAKGEVGRCQVAVWDWHKSRE